MKVESTGQVVRGVDAAGILDVSTQHSQGLGRGVRHPRLDRFGPAPAFVLRAERTFQKTSHPWGFVAIVYAYLTVFALVVVWNFAYA